MGIGLSCKNMALTRQQQAFADLILEGRNQTDAYKQAGYKCANDNVAAVSASELVRNPKVATYIEQKRQMAAQMAQIDLQWLIRESVELYQLAKQDRAHGAANAALKTIGVYTGLWDEKSTRQNINRTVDEYTDAELASYLSGRSGGGIAEKAKSSEKPH